MKTVIGLGGAGCKIADKFAQREGYKIYKIDENLQGTRCYSFKKISSMEEAESSVSSLKSFFKGLTKDVLFIVAGGGKISGASLAILEQIRNKNVEILYVRPDLDTLSGVNIQSEKIVSQVLQNMTRSGVFQKMYLFDNQKIQEILQGVSLLKLNDSINEVIARSYDLTNFYQGQESVFGQSGQVDEISRIATFGFISFDDDIHRMCFDLENITHAEIFYVVNEKILDEDSELLYKIKQQVRSVSHEDMKSLQYSVHPSEYEGVQAYCRLHTHYIQQEEN
tara:strand:- start:11404 stop:12243 length:840 start_codon:yes stop_codon:yes gene_type:complete